jgi:hypothetical protein
VFVSGVGIVEEEATIESSKSFDEAEAGRPQEALDLVGPELAMTKSNGAFWAAWGALVVDGLVVEAHVQQVRFRVEDMVGGVDQPLFCRRMVECGSTPATFRIAAKPLRIGRKHVESEPPSWHQVGVCGAKKP